MKTLGAHAVSPALILGYETEPSGGTTCATSVPMTTKKVATLSILLLIGMTGQPSQASHAPDCHTVNQINRDLYSWTMSYSEFLRISENLGSRRRVSKIKSGLKTGARFLHEAKIALGKDEYDVAAERSLIAFHELKDVQAESLPRTSKALKDLDTVDLDVNRALSELTSFFGHAGVCPLPMYGYYEPWVLRK